MVRAIDPPNLPPSQWLCCQLGAREHYAIPRALLRVDMLGCLVTDAWVPRSSLLAKICGRRSNLAEIKTRREVSQQTAQRASESV